MSRSELAYTHSKSYSPDLIIRRPTHDIHIQSDCVTNHMPFMDYIAFQGIVDERMEREIGLFEDHGWRVRVVLIHPKDRWIIQKDRGKHILIPSRVVSHPLMNQLFLFPLIIFSKYLRIFLMGRSELRLLYVQNFPDVYSVPFLLLGKLFGIPTAYEIADPWKEFELTETSEQARRRDRFAFYYGILSMIERLAISLASGIVFASESLSELHSTNTKEKPSFILYNYSAYSYDDELKGQGERLRSELNLKQNFVISYVGGFQTYRGIDILLQSIPIVAKENPRVRLILVGAHGDALRRTKERIRELGIDTVCILTKWVTTDEVKLYYAASDVGVIPYRRTAATELTSPNKLFNYLVLGKPVIISRLNELSRYFENETCGLKVEPDDPAELASAIVTLSQNKPLLGRMKRNIAQIGPKYRFENLRAGFIQFISKLARVT